MLCVRDLLIITHAMKCKTNFKNQSKESQMRTEDKTMKAVSNHSYTSYLALSFLPATLERNTLDNMVLLSRGEHPGAGEAGSPALSHACVAVASSSGIGAWRASCSASIVTLEMLL